ncbi:hypothetical protein B0H19DRAFT_1170165 [Mycena capillaripes]|nr:hypothetical protein B0H19DRAFT_1170165 [Mycena capillaripes]
MRSSLSHLIFLPSRRISVFSPRFLGGNLRYATNSALNARSVSPAEPQPSLESPEQLETRRNNELVASFMQFIDLVKDEPQKDLQKGWIRDRFRAEELQIPTRAKIAENIIHSLFERRLFAQAIAVYHHMLEDDLVPSPSTDALFLAVSLAASTAPAKTQLEGLKTILAYRSFTETHFIELLDHLIALKIPADASAHLTEVFISVKGEDYRPSRALVIKLVDLQTRAGDVFAAAETIAEYKNFDSPAEPYAQMLHSASDEDQAAVDWIMGVMREKDVPVHIMVFNALLARQKHAKDMRRAFAFYNVILQLAATTPLKPDAITYKHLFRLLGYQYKTAYKPNSSRSKEPIGDITPPRQLFADMMALWFSARLHPPASSLASERQSQIATDQGLLTLAFRTFLYVEDYAGALVVLRTTSDLGLEINERTYSVLMRYLARRVYYDVHRSRLSFKQPFLTFELMGPFPPWKMDQDPEVVYRWIMEGLLKHNCEEVDRKGQEEDEDDGPTATWRGRIPTVDEILAQSRNMAGGRVDHFPIVNMLRRALQMRPSRTGMPWGDEWRKETVRKARYEMFPKNPTPLWTWPQEKKK